MTRAVATCRCRRAPEFGTKRRCSASKFSAARAGGVSAARLLREPRPAARAAQFPGLRSRSAARRRSRTVTRIACSPGSPASRACSPMSLAWRRSSSLSEDDSAELVGRSTGHLCSRRVASGRAHRAPDRPPSGKCEPGPRLPLQACAWVVACARSAWTRHLTRVPPRGRRAREGLAREGREAIVKVFVMALGNSGSNREGWGPACRVRVGVRVLIYLPQPDRRSVNSDCRSRTSGPGRDLPAVRGCGGLARYQHAWVCSRWSPAPATWR